MNKCKECDAMFDRVREFVNAIRDGDLLRQKLAELAELRAYKGRTEAALTEFSSELSNYGGVPTNYYRQELRRLGLWREGGAAGTAQE